MRSNSAGAVYGMRDPADVFGSMVLDHSPIKEDIDKSTHHLHRSPTLAHRNAFAEEVSLVAQGSPLKSPPAIFLSNHTEKSPKKERDNNQVSHYEFGKSMYNYAKRKAEKAVNHSDIPISKSDGDLQGKKALVNNLSNSHLNKSHHHHQHQCCSGFGTGNRHRFQSNACVIN